MRSLPVLRTPFRLLSHVFLLLALAGPARAQLTVTGEVRDDAGAAVPFANVQLLAAADSALVAGTVADEAGVFTLERVAPGAYRLHVSLIGYREHLSEVLTLSGSGTRRVGPFTLRPDVHEMQELSVEARRELYEHQGDRLVINVGTSVTLAGATALEVLERSPGVVVDRLSETISLVGKSGVRVMINGRLSHIPADGLVPYLSGLSADDIERIELITSPPADLDAEGNAGYINLVLKRHPDDGLSGTANASAGYGAGGLGNTGTSVNYRRNRISVYGSYAFRWNSQPQFFSNFRRVVADGGTTEMPTVSERDPVRRHHNARLGLDYQVGSSTTVGALVAAYDNALNVEAHNRLTISHDGTPVTRLDSDSDELNHWQHLMGNLNLRHQLGSHGTISTDLDYLYYHNSNPTDYLNTSTDVASGQVTEELMESQKLTPLRILVAKADYLTGGRGAWTLGAGVKGSFSRFTNEARFESLVQDAWLDEAGLDSKARLREDVLAIYGKADYQTGASVSLKMGLRYELTGSNLRSEEGADLVDRRFGSLFPSVAYTHKLGGGYQVNASYTRRITRPSFNDMAPYLYFQDPYMFYSGNTALQPAIVNTVKLDLTYRSLLLSLGYAWEDSTIARFQSRLIPGRNIQLMAPVNFRGTESLTALVALPVRLAGWWSTQNNLMLIRSEIDGFRNGDPAVFRQKRVRFNTTHNLSLPYGFDLELSGFYQSAGLIGAIRLDPFWGIHAGLQHALPDGRSRLTLSVNDIFDSIQYAGTTGSPGDAFYLEQLFDFGRRTFQLTLATRFGDAKSARKRATASEEESQRVEQ